MQPAGKKCVWAMRERESLPKHDKMLDAQDLLTYYALRGPADTFISRDTCSNSIAKVFRACFGGGGGGIAQYVANGYRTDLCACVKLSAKGGV